MLLLRYLINILSKYPKVPRGTPSIKYPGVSLKGTVLDKKGLLGYIGVLGEYPGKLYWTWLKKYPYKIPYLTKGVY